jgi:hypothetical protein
LNLISVIIVNWNGKKFIRLRLNTLSRLQRDCRDDWSSPGATTQLKKAGVNRAEMSRRSFKEGGSSPEHRRVYRAIALRRRIGYGAIPL